MKRFGYTLAETLIAMAVVGIIAMVCAPLVNSFRPDEYKAKFLSTYDAISEITQKMVSNTELYPVSGTDGKIYYEVPLANTQKFELSQNEEYGGINKYCRLLAMALGSQSNKCSDDPFLLRKNTYQNVFDDDDDKISFTSQNGIDFFVGTQYQLPYFFQINILFDVDGVGNGKDCFFDKTTCTHPDRFIMTVAADGYIETPDPKSKIYLLKRSNWRLNKDEGGYSEDNYDEKWLNNVGNLNNEHYRLRVNNNIISIYD